MAKALQAFLLVAFLSIVVFVPTYLLVRHYEVALLASSLSIYVVWEYLEVKDWVRDEFGCISYAIPIVLPILIWLIFKSYVAPAWGLSALPILRHALAVSTQLVHLL